MATVFKVSEAQWVKVGLPAHAHKKLLALGYTPHWKSGGGFTLTDKSGTDWGFAKVKGDVVTPDHVFKSKYAEIIGSPLTVDKENALAAAISKVAASPVLKVKSESVSVPQALSSKNLSTVDEVGIWVKGTDSPYLVYMLSDDANIAFRFKSGQLAIRAEKMSSSAKQALSSWGMVPKKMGDGREYASVHLSVHSEEIARRTLGSVVASILSGPPKALLPKEKVTE